MRFGSHIDRLEDYRNPEGKRKKQALNAQRNGHGKKSMIVDCVDKSTIMHVQMVTGLIVSDSEKRFSPALNVGPTPDPANVWLNNWLS